MPCTPAPSSITHANGCAEHQRPSTVREDISILDAITLVALFVCFIASAVQGFDFIGVAKASETSSGSVPLYLTRPLQAKPVTFRRYLTLHILTTTAAFSIALIWIIMSATCHSTAQPRCESKFFPNAPNTPTSSEGQIICNIVPWIHVGVNGGLWILLACVQVSIRIGD